MTELKKYGLNFLYFILSLIISITILTIFYHFNIISTKTFNTLELIAILINVLVSTYMLGKTAKEKAYLEGLKFSALTILTFILLTLITKQNLSIRILIYHTLIITTSLLGSITGINHKKSK